jgi:hypothetical protein
MLMEFLVAFFPEYDECLRVVLTLLIFICFSFFLGKTVKKIEGSEKKKGRLENLKNINLNGSMWVTILGKL